MRRISVHAPSQTIFIVSLIFVVIGVLDAVTTIFMLPIAPLWIVTIGYVILALGCWVRGI
ncbi:hypothetical protein C8N35_107156 [Breoghania corrubedonensis]|uniref:Uncharacterized protein n=1 Tax=Breoghania corrubedonensis TaxID=665038 RepID=A0A2T5V6R1_9HYPH|nr:hypothetical protein [Breoghania corrubedonensis]PTW59442.1 hypothetical protein C8N35_107156 [Breoghania corrubedonensis]